MRIPVKSWLSAVIAALLGICVLCGPAVGAGKPHYVITNDDVFGEGLTSSVTVYTVGANGLLTMKEKLPIGFGGIAGGYFEPLSVLIFVTMDSPCKRQVFYKSEVDFHSDALRAVRDSRYLKIAPDELKERTSPHVNFANLESPWLPNNELPPRAAYATFDSRSFEDRLRKLEKRPAPKTGMAEECGENCFKRDDGVAIYSYWKSRLTRSDSIQTPVVTVKTCPLQLVGRHGRVTTTEVRVGKVIIGGKSVVVIAGPCSVEPEEQLLTAAWAVKAAGASILRGGADKPRSSPYAFQGLGLLGLRRLEQASQETGLPTVTEVMSTEDADPIADHADMLQVGARSMQDFPLLRTLSKMNALCF